ncbi:saccharopine dehydrogenase NADP-binding domain-containing protein, partial [Pseudanabaenaceae cyanobacterium LEGE 13415]|nr:saccharopine dehydrogenase NADP-binding domain-containing protein [Pseudanabaenaceae cyanobacterium LEGE 13415]
MTQQVLILGGTGRIGTKVAADLIAHTSAEITIAGRNLISGAEASQQLGERVKFCAIDLFTGEGLKEAIAQADLVVHCAGPFHYR